MTTALETVMLATAVTLITETRTPPAATLVATVAVSEDPEVVTAAQATMHVAGEMEISIAADADGDVVALAPDHAPLAATTTPATTAIVETAEIATRIAIAMNAPIVALQSRVEVAMVVLALPS